MKIIKTLILICILSSCVSNTIKERPSNEEFFHITDTPVYVAKSSEVDQSIFDEDLSNCLKSAKNKADASDKLGTGLGSAFVVTGLYTIVTASGVFAPIAVVGGYMGAIAGGGAIWATKATGEYREYSNLEVCLERLGHNVVFFDARKQK